MILTHVDLIQKLYASISIPFPRTTAPRSFLELTRLHRSLHYNPVEPLPQTQYT